MRSNRRNLYAVFILVLLCSLSACKDSALQKVSDALNITAKTVGTIQDTAIAANQQRLITDIQTQHLLEVTVQVSVAGKQAVALTRNISTLDAMDKASLIKILNPVITAVNTAVSNGTADIKDQKTKQDIQTLLLTLQASLNTINLTIAAK